MYYRARFYDPKLGRFISEDPIGFGGGDINLYGYVRNNPVFFSDPSGKFPSWWRFNYHKNITARSLSGRASPRQIEIMGDEQYSFDSNTQDPAYAPWHAMARPGQSPEDSRREANIFVRNRICIARRLSAGGNEEGAMRYLGQAMHTMQDSASPAHHGFQSAWPNTFFGNAGQALPFGHYHRENFDPGPSSAADANTRRAWDYYSGQSPMPGDFFDNAYDTRGGIGYTPYVSYAQRQNSYGAGGNCGC